MKHIAKTNLEQVPHWVPTSAQMPPCSETLYIDGMELLGKTAVAGVIRIGEREESVAKGTWVLRDRVTGLFALVAPDNIC